VLALVLASAAQAKLNPEKINYWNRIHNCEQPSTWSMGGTYQGGLGMYWSTWDWWAGELGLARRYPDAGHAPPIVQMRVADYGYRAHRGYWGCFRHVGYPPS
jgi:hypothetical protein